MRVRTVLGDVDPAALGPCDAHDHLFLRTPLLAGRELDDTAAAAAELTAFATAGGGALVQWTPIGLGRRAGELPALSRASGVHLVAATGLHQEVHYPREVLSDLLPRLEEVLVAELTAGIADTGVRAGLVKVATCGGGPDPHARRVLAAAAAASRATGAPVAVHLDAGTRPEAVLDELCDRHGLPPARVLLGHLGRQPDPAAALAAARAGAFVVLDGPSPLHPAASAALPGLLDALAGDGHLDRVLVGADTTTAAARSGAGGPGAAHLLRVLRPWLAGRLGEGAARAVFTANPRRALAAAWRGPGAAGT